MVRQIGIIFGCLFLGKVLVSFTGIPIPASLVGFFILFILLQSKLIRINDIGKAGEFFNRNISFFFVPAGVAIYSDFPALLEHFWIVLATTIISFVMVIWASGRTFQYLRKKTKSKR